MSGGGGGGSSDDWRTPKSGGNTGGAGKCAIVETTILNSPVQAVVSTLAIGSELEVALEGPPRKRLVAKNAQGAVAGSITSARLVDLIECVEAGFEYVAEVLSVNGGRVEIEIRPK